MSKARAKPSARLGDTQDMLARWVETGDAGEGTEAQPAELPSSRPAVQTATQPSGRLDGNMHGSADRDADDMAVIRAAREARERPPERMVKTTVRLPEDVAVGLRIAAIREGVTMADITTDILRLWLRRYERWES